MNINSGSKISAWIDFLKGFAIFEIVAFHYFGDHASEYYGTRLFSGSIFDQIFGFLVNVTRVGSQGIHVFFFMSGFGLMLSKRRYSSVFGFYRIRFSKIYPPLLMAIIFVVVLHYSLGREVFDNNYLISVLASISLMQNYSFDWIRTVNGNWWFVGALIPMYLVFPYFRDRVAEKPLYYLVATFFVSFFYKLFIVYLMLEGHASFDAGELNPISAFFLNYFWVFMAGVACSCFDVNLWISRCTAKKIFVMLFAAVCLEVVGVLFGLTRIGRVFNDDIFFVAQLLALSLLFIIFQQSKFLSNMLVRPLALLGATSYGIYLVHHPLSRAVSVFGLNDLNLAFIILAFPLYFCVAWLVGRVIEMLGGVLAKNVF